MSALCVLAAAQPPRAASADEGLVIELLWLAAMVVLSAFFSGLEIALFSLGKAHLLTMVESGVRGARTVARLKENPERLLVTILIGNNVVNIGAASVATALAIRLFGSFGIGLATGVMTLLILIFGEIMPKSFAYKWSGRISLLGARPLQVIGWLLFPIVWLLEQLTRALTRLAESRNGRPTVEHRSLLLSLARLGLESGTLDAREHRAVASALRLDRVPVSRVMTPRRDIVAVSHDALIEEAADELLESPYSRFPIYRETKDDVVGMLTLRDAFERLRAGGGGSTVESVASKPHFVPTTMTIGTLMRIFQHERTHQAIVIGEYGETVGLVTLEDIIEEMVGEIEDEADLVRNRIIKLADNRYLVEASVPIEDLNRAVGIAMPGEQHHTLNGLLTDEYQGIPKPGSRIDIGNKLFVVRQADAKRVIRVEMLITEPEIQ